MDDRTILRLAAYATAMVALIVAGAVGRGIVNRDGRQWWQTAAATVVALAAIVVAYRIATRHFFVV